MSDLGTKCVLAIDPGSRKHGLALVCRREEGGCELLWHKVVPADELEEALSEASATAEFHMIIVGSGTRSRTVIEWLRDQHTGIGLLIVDETDTTLQARERYWEHNPRRGWRRLLPATLQVPPEPIDDYAALVLAERVLLDA